MHNRGERANIIRLNRTVKSTENCSVSGGARNKPFSQKGGKLKRFGERATRHATSLRVTTGGQKLREASEEQGGTQPVFESNGISELLRE